MPRLRRLTAKGIERFQGFIDSMSTDEPESYDPVVVNDPAHSKAVEGGAGIPDTCAFSTRFEVAECLSGVIRGAELEEPAFDRGFWCWVSWLWFESLCLPDRDGRRRPREAARWVLNLDWNRYYRHLLAGPWWVYEAHRDDPQRAQCLLCTPVTSPGELVAQIASRQELVTNPGLVAMITQLYFDPTTGGLKRGHGTKGPGSARRMADVVDQLDMIWDLYSTSAEEFHTLVPEEFDRFRTHAASTASSRDGSPTH